MNNEQLLLLIFISTYEDSLLASPLILNLTIITELITRVEYCNLLISFIYSKLAIENSTISL